MRSFYQIQKRIRWALAHKDQIVYLYGCKGKLGSDGYPRALTKTDIRSYIKEEPDHFAKYTKEEIENEIIPNTVGKFGFDCSGLVCFLTGETGYSKEIYAKRTEETTLEKSAECQFIFTDFDNPNKRHIMLDAGCGYIIHIAAESSAKNIAKGKAGLLLQTYDEFFQMFDKHTVHSFKTAAVNYNGALVSDPNAVPKKKGTGTISNCSAVNLRCEPKATAAICFVDLEDGKGARGQLYAGETVKVVGDWFVNGATWVNIELSGHGHVWTPWVHSAYIDYAV